MVAGFIKEIKKEGTVIDVDKVAKDIYSRNPEILKQLRELFGKDIFNPRGELVLRLLAEKVFLSKSQLMKLNKLMFPLMKSEVIGILDKKTTAGYIIIDAAVLFGCGLDELCDYIILVKNSIERRKDNLRESRFSAYEIKLRIEGQYIEIDKDKVDFIINNNGSKEDLFLKVKKILENI